MQELGRAAVDQMSGSVYQFPLVFQKQVRVHLSVDLEGVGFSGADLRDVRQVGRYGTGDLEPTIMAKKRK